MLADYVNTLTGEYHDGCSASDFLLHMSVAGIYPEYPKTINSGQWRVFWNESSSATIGVKQESIQDKIKYFLLDNKCWAEFAEDALVQLWVPATTAAGRTKLTSSVQPFGITTMGGNEMERDRLYKGLCSYRCYSIHLGDFAHDITQLGSLGRVFSKGYPEFCGNIKAYSIEEFPTRDYAIECSIARYWALPLFQLGAHQQHCVGVLLEGLSFGIVVSPILNTFGMILNALEHLGLQCPDYDHRDKCLNSRVKLLESQEGIIEMIKSLKDECRLPLSQVWVPCMCDAAHQAFVEVSRSTLKRICREHDLDRWPSCKRNKIRGVHSSPRPIEVGNGSEVFQKSEIVVPENEAAAAISARAMKKIRSFGEEIDQSYSMEVKATYMDDTVLFNLSSDSKMEALRRNLEERFELDGLKRYKKSSMNMKAVGL